MEHPKPLALPDVGVIPGNKRVYDNFLHIGCSVPEDVGNVVVGHANYRLIDAGCGLRLL